MLYPLLFVSFVLMAMSHPSGPPSPGQPPHGPCGHPPGPPKCPSNDNKHGDKHHPRGSPLGPIGGPIMGPVGVIYCNLTRAEQKQVNQIVESGLTKTKKEVKTSMDSFVSGLSSELQAAVTAEKQHFEEMKANITSKVKTLSQAAQGLSAQVSAVIENDSLTFKEDKEKLDEIVEAADKSVVKEFIDNHIPLPGLCPPGPPPHHGDKKHHKKH